MQTKTRATANVPMRWVGPMHITGDVLSEDISAPLATYESPLWPSTARGAKVSMACDGIAIAIPRDVMTRSILFEAPSGSEAARCALAIMNDQAALSEVVASTTRYGRLQDLHWQIVGSLLFLRIGMQTGDAAGHNMVTAAADAAMTWLLERYPALTYVSISGNYCTDKKASAVNGILGRGKYVIADMLIPADVCTTLLRTTPAAIAKLNTAKNLVGTSLAGGIRSANAHVANMLLALYLATGQDGANIIEGSQAYTFAEVRDGDLYFSVTLPNVIVGTVGNGKELEFVRANLERLGCLADRTPGQNAQRLAAVAGAAVLCGELSLLAAQTNPGELMQAHRRLERKRDA